MQRRAVVLLAHGSRDPLWCRTVEAVATRMRELDDKVPVACAYLELMGPDLKTAAAELVATGADWISVVPVFLGIGRHARQDLPLLTAALALQHPTVRVDLKPAIGEDQRVVNLIALIALSG